MKFSFHYVHIFLIQLLIVDNQCSSKVSTIPSHKFNFHSDEYIPMTVPVTTHYTPAEGGKERMAMCFYLGAPSQANPPQPTNSDVYLQDRPAMTIYTRYGHIQIFRRICLELALLLPWINYYLFRCIFIFN